MGLYRLFSLRSIISIKAQETTMREVFDALTITITITIQESKSDNSRKMYKGYYIKAEC